MDPKKFSLETTFLFATFSEHMQAWTAALAHAAGSPQSYWRQRDRVLHTRGFNCLQSLTSPPVSEVHRLPDWSIRQMMALWGEGTKSSSNILFLHKMKNYGTLDDAYIVGQRDLTSTHSKLSSGKRLFTNFYILPPPLYSEKEKKDYIYRNIEIYICKAGAKLERKCLTAGIHCSC